VEAHSLGERTGNYGVITKFWQRAARYIIDFKIGQSCGEPQAPILPHPALQRRQASRGLLQGQNSASTTGHSLAVLAGDLDHVLPKFGS